MSKSQRILLLIAAGLCVLWAGAQVYSRMPHTPATTQSQPAVPQSAPAAAQPAVEEPAASEPEPAPEPEKPIQVQINYPNGKSCILEVDSQNNVLSYTDNSGGTWKFDPPEAAQDAVVPEADQDLWHRFKADGTKVPGASWHGTAELKEDNTLVLSETDGQMIIYDPSGAVFTGDHNQALLRIDYPNGSSRGFTYNDDGDIALIEETSAKGTVSYIKRTTKDDDVVYQACHMQKDVCKPSGKAFDLKVDESYTLTLTDRDEGGSTTIHYANGSTVTTVQEK